MRRKKRQVEFDAGDPARLPPGDRRIRESEWTVAPIPADLLDRRVEITGPVDRKMIINALNSGANVFMADFEDSNSPTWANNLDGQINLRDAIRRRDQLRQPGRQAYAVERAAGHACWCARAAGIWRRRHFCVDGAADLGQPLRLRPVLLSQREGT